MTENSLSSKKSNRSIYRVIFSNIELFKLLVHRDIKVKYRHTMLGYFWAMAPQLATAILFSLLASRRVFNMGTTDLPYLIHVLWSISVWQLFSSIIMNSQMSLIQSGNLILKVQFERVILVLASIVRSLIDFMIRLLPLIVISVYYQQSYQWLIIITPLVLIFVILMALGVGLYLSCINLVMSDLKNLVGMVLTFGMFLSPILYAPPTKGIFALINVVNPFSPLLIATQNLLAGELPTNLVSLGISMLLALVLFFSGWRFFHVALPRVIERA